VFCLFLFVNGSEIVVAYRNRILYYRLERNKVRPHFFRYFSKSYFH